MNVKKILNCKLIALTAIFMFLACNGENIKQKSQNYNNIGLTYLLHEKFDSALIYFNLAIDLDSNNYIPQSNKIATLINLKNYELALNESIILNKKYKGLAENTMLTAILADYLKKEELALRYYTESLSIFSKRINLSKKTIDTDYLNRALVKKMIGDTTYIKDFEKIKHDKYFSSLSQEFEKLSKNEIIMIILNEQTEVF